MKQLWAFLVIFTLFAAGLFAEIEVTGVVGSGSTLAKGTNIANEVDEFDEIIKKNDDILVYNYFTGYLEGTIQDENGAAGATVRVGIDATTEVQSLIARANGWWKPIPFLKLQVGFIEDFGVTDIVGWGYHANDADEYVVYPKNSYAGGFLSDTAGFYSGTPSTWLGAALTFNPIKGLTFTFAAPLGIPAGRAMNYSALAEETSLSGPTLTGYVQPKAADVYRRSHAQVAYDIWGVGRLAISFSGEGDINLLEYHDDDPELIRYSFYPAVFPTMSANVSTFYGSFFLTAFEDYGIYLNVGFEYTLPYKAKFDLNETEKIDVTYNLPMAAGIGASWGTAEYGIKARIGATFGGSAVMEGVDPLNEPIKFAVGVLPYYTYRHFRLYLNAGLSFKPEENVINAETSNYFIQELKDTSAFGWHLNPYITINAGLGTFYAGFQIGTDGVPYRRVYAMDYTIRSHHPVAFPLERGVSFIEWGIPIGFQLMF
ncbi:MAG: hypothetical protein FWG46_05185 [Treponema sp.]|nr:hypothetical protein [Treponema sp.]